MTAIHKNQAPDLHTMCENDNYTITIWLFLFSAINRRHGNINFVTPEKNSNL